MSDVLLYNPHDGLSTFTYRGTDFSIAPNEVTKIEVPKHLRVEGITAQTIAGHAVAAVGKWGVIIVSGDAKEDAPRKAAAEKAYTKAMREWCEEQILGYEAAQEPRRKVGLRELDVSEDVVKARRWLQKRGLLKQ